MKPKPHIVFLERQLCKRRKLVCVRYSRNERRKTMATLNDLKEKLSQRQKEELNKVIKEDKISIEDIVKFGLLSKETSNDFRTECGY